MAASTLLLATALFVCLIPSAFAGSGLDVSQAFSTSSWSCWRSDSNVQLAIVRAWQSAGRIDNNAAQSLKNAKAAGYTYQHVYLSPCATTGCPSASSQATNMYNTLYNAGAPFTKVWIDVESTSWSTNTATNQQFLTNLIGGLKSTGLTTAQIGIYTSQSQWTGIMGSADFHSNALWYANYDNVQSFADFSAFNGWTTPCMKQFARNQSVPCAGATTPQGANKNYYASTGCF